ncbi:MAG: hypothetical protein WD689_01175 [Gaiellaceae bacterium]
MKRVLTIGTLGGMLAGMMMAAVEMLYGWLSEAHTFWDAPMAIWAWVAGLDWFGEPADHVGSIVLGIGGHELVAAARSLGYAALVARKR